MLFVLAVAASGCAGVPDRSPARIVEGAAPDDQAPAAPQFLDIKPAPDDDQQEIVRKFLEAQVNAEGDHGMARQFLTAEAAMSWDPDALVRVVDDLQHYVRQDGNSVIVSVWQLGLIASDGSYTPFQRSVSGQDEYRFTLTEDHGEWRIEDLPKGLILKRKHFNFGYGSYDLHYLDPAMKRLVPDLRYFPSSISQPGLATTLLNSLLDGPSAALEGAVSTALTDVTLTSNVGQDQGSTALRVNLTGLRSKSELERRAAAAQIVWTLSQVGVPSVEILDDGRPVNFEGVAQPSQRNDWQPFSPDGPGLGTTGYFVRGGAVLTTEGVPVNGPAGAGAYELTAVAILRAPPGDPDRLAGIASSNGTTQLYVGPLGGELASVLRARTLTPPSWDSTGDVWTVRDGRMVTRVTPGGVPITVGAQGLVELGAVHQLRLSRDGVRVAVIAGNPAHLYVGRVLRNQDGVEVSIDAFVDIAPSFDRILDADWATSTRLLVVGDDRTGRVIKEMTVDGAGMTSETSGSRESLPAPVTDVAAAPNLEDLSVSDGGVWRRSADRWVPLLPGRSDGAAPVYPG